MRLIDADALLEELNERRYDQESPSLILTPAGQEIYNSGIDAAWFAVTGSETADAVPVVHARWVDPCINKYGHPCHHCSACRFKASQKDRNYCPNCGARMDGEADG